MVSHVPVHHRSSRRPPQRVAALLLAGLLGPFAAPLLAPSASAYPADVHQQLTFLAARQLNRCLDAEGLPRLSPLQVRYVVKYNVGEVDTNVWRRWTRWHYYDRGAGEEKSLLWFIETRLHARFNDSAEALADADSTRAWAKLGILTNYMQDVTVPAHAVPVYYGRWWRFSTSDRFAEFPVDLEALEAATTDACAEVLTTAVGTTPQAVLDAAAADTLAAVRAPITGMDATWQVFWREADRPGAFGEYGRVGNSFGRSVSFTCGELRCHLLHKDPLYHAFALARHRAAVLATMRALVLVHRGQAEGVAAFAARDVAGTGDDDG